MLSPNSLIKNLMHNYNTSNSLLTLLWNANRLKNHKNELLFTLQEKIIDIVLIFEIIFTTNPYVNLLGYDSYRGNHLDNTAHAGAAIYIKSSLKYTPLPNFISDDIQTYAISLMLNVTVVYTVKYN